MHFVRTTEIKKLCPQCKSEHKANFDSEFYKFRHYLIGCCDNCKYRLIILEDEMSSGKKVEKILSKNYKPR